MANTVEADSDSDFEFYSEEENEELDELHKKILEEQTMRDPTIRPKFLECLERANAPKDWESLLRYPYIKGKPAHKQQDRKMPLPNQWTPGHELKRNKEGGILWYCTSVAPDGGGGRDLYLRHSVQIWPDGRLIGSSYTGGGKIDIPDVKRILDSWHKSLDQKEEQYWDQVTG